MRACYHGSLKNGQTGIFCYARELCKSHPLNMSICVGNLAGTPLRWGIGDITNACPVEPFSQESQDCSLLRKLLDDRAVETNK